MKVDYSNTWGESETNNELSTYFHFGGKDLSSQLTISFLSILNYKIGIQKEKDGRRSRFLCCHLKLVRKSLGKSQREKDNVNFGIKHLNNIFKDMETRFCICFLNLKINFTDINSPSSK